MDLNKDEIRIYIATLSGILKMIDNMPSPNVKKIRTALRDEFNATMKKVGEQNKPKTIN